MKLDPVLWKRKVVNSGSTHMVFILQRHPVQELWRSEFFNQDSKNATESPGAQIVIY
jgi:hypothetical protein